MSQNTSLEVDFSLSSVDDSLTGRLQFMLKTGIFYIRLY